MTSQCWVLNNEVPDDCCAVKSDVCDKKAHSKCLKLLDHSVRELSQPREETDPKASCEPCKQNNRKNKIDKINLKLEISSPIP